MDNKIQSKSQNVLKASRENPFIISCCINLDLNPTLIPPLLTSDFLFCISFICAVLKELFFIFHFLCASQGMILKWTAWLTLRSWGWSPKKSATLDEWPLSTWTRPSCSGPGRTLSLQPDARLLLSLHLLCPHVLNRRHYPVHTGSVKVSASRLCPAAAFLTNIPSGSCFLFTYFAIWCAQCCYQSVYLSNDVTSYWCYHLISSFSHGSLVKLLPLSGLGGLSFPKLCLLFSSLYPSTPSLHASLFMGATL